jgi:hypothetical protein
LLQSIQKDLDVDLKAISRIKLAWYKRPVVRMLDYLMRWRNRMFQLVGLFADPLSALYRKLDGQSLSSPQLEDTASKEKRSDGVARLLDLARAGDSANISIAPINFLRLGELYDRFGPIEGSQEMLYGRYDSQLCVVAFRDYSPSTDDRDREYELQATLALMARLRVNNLSEFGLLSSMGYSEYTKVHRKFNNKFGLVFLAPNKANKAPQTLGAFLNNSGSNPKHPLQERFRLAKQITTGLFFLHVSKFVHKNIHSKSVILFGAEDNLGAGLGQAYLLGFDSIRPSATATRPSREIEEKEELAKYLYVHPQKWQSAPLIQTTYMHDVYSLGVLLLEIGLWEPFVGSTPFGRPLVASHFYHDTSTEDE